MGFEPLNPRRGVPTLRAPVTIAWRHHAGRKVRVLHIHLDSKLAASVGFKTGTKAVAERDKPNGLLRLRPALEGELARAWSIGWRRKGDEKARIILPLEGVQSEQRIAENVLHTIEGRALVLTLPEWAAPERAATDRAAAAAARARERMRAA